MRAWLELAGGRLQIRVDDRGAAYPVRVDPIIQQAKLTASDGAAATSFGLSVGVSGNGSTVVVGAPGAKVGSNDIQGAAYVFTEPASGWSSFSGHEAAKLTASDGAAGDQLGQSVGVSGDGSTVVAGAPRAMLGGNPDQGAAYVFTEPASGWASFSGHEAAKLTASDGAASLSSPGLAQSVGVSGDGSTVVAGAPGAAVGNIIFQGAAYVFTRPPSGWSSFSGHEAAKLTASDGAAGDQLSSSVGVSGNGSTVVAGAPGAAVGGNSGQGAAYVFTEPASGWPSFSGHEAAKLTASDGAAGDGLGQSVGVSGNGSTVATGAPGAAVGNNQFQGAAYVFTEPASGWSSFSGHEAAKLTASDGAAAASFGLSVGVSGDGSTMFAGAPFATVGGKSGQGAAYVFTEPASGWSSFSGHEAAKLTASDGAADDGFGQSVGLRNGSTVIVGAPFQTVGGNSGQGAAYVFGSTHMLSVAKAGSGSGTVTSTDGNIDCGSTCSHTYPSGAHVTLNAQPVTGSTFTGWSGACSGTGACTVTISSDRSVTATFTAAAPAIVKPPVVVTGSAGGAGLRTATVHGSVNPNDAATNYHFEYGTSTRYGKSTVPHSAGSGTGPVPVSARLSGLHPGAVYHYRLVATNGGGTTPGADRVFHTKAVIAIAGVSRVACTRRSSTILRVRVTSLLHGRTTIKLDGRRIARGRHARLRARLTLSRLRAGRHTITVTTTSRAGTTTRRLRFIVCAAVVPVFTG